ESFCEAIIEICGDISIGSCDPVSLIAELANSIRGTFDDRYAHNWS
ncbi:1383_t:CDS:2, partial [Diversispora eburnea]